jgi:hypothetical protein
MQDYEQMHAKTNCCDSGGNREQVSVSTPLPSSGFARYAWSGIIPGPSPPFDKPLPEFCCGNSRVVLFVELPFNNTVVLEGPCVGGWSLVLVTWRTDEIHRRTILKLS